MRLFIILVQVVAAGRIRVVHIISVPVNLSAQIIEFDEIVSVSPQLVGDRGRFAEWCRYDADEFAASL